MKRNELADIFISKAINLVREGDAITLEEAIYDAHLSISQLPNYDENRVFTDNDVEYIQKELASAWRFNWEEFDDMVFYNNNLKAVLSY